MAGRPSRHRFAQRVLVVGVLALAAAPARGGGEGESAIDQAVRQVDEQNAGAIQALADCGGAADWILVDELAEMGRVAYAKVVAKAAPRDDVDPLLAYVASRPTSSEDDRRVREAVRKSEALLAATRKPPAAGAAEKKGAADANAGIDAALAALDLIVPPPAAGVLAVRYRRCRADALKNARPPRLLDAGDAYEQAAAAAKGVGWAWAERRSLLDGAKCAGDGHDAATARSRYEIARVEWDRAGSESDVAYIDAALAALAATVANYPEARRLYALARREFAALDRTDQDDPLLWVDAQAALVEARAGNFVVAIDGLRGVLDRLKGAPENSLDAIEALGDLGTAYAALGDVANAEKTLQQAIDRAHAAAATDPAYAEAEALAYGNLAYMRWDLEEWEPSLEMYRVAREKFEGLHDEPSIANADLGIASALAGLGHVEEALKLFEEVRERARRLGARLEAAAATEGIGDAYRAAGDAKRGEVLDDAHRTSYEKAIEAYTTALAEAQDLAVTLNVLRVHARIAHCERALGHLSRAIVAARAVLDETSVLLDALPAESGASIMKRRLEAYEDGARAAAATPNATSLFDFLEAARSTRMLQLLGGRGLVRSLAVPEALTKDEASAIADERAAAERLSEAASVAKDRAALAPLQAAAKAARERTAAAARRVEEEEAKRGLPPLLRPRRISLDELQVRLREDLPGATLVSYALFSDASLAIVVTEDTARIVALKGIAALAPTFDRLATLRARDRTSDAADVLGVMRAQLVEPLKLAPGSGPILIVPDGALAYVPFGALLSPRPVSMIPSASVLDLLLRDRMRSGKGVLAVGDPIYDRLRGSPSLATLRSAPKGLPSLPGTGDEAKAAAGAEDAKSSVLLLGKDATEARVRKELENRSSEKGRWRAIHFGCHGLIDADRPRLSALALTPQGADDGLLTTLELFRLPMHADLAVLSACGSGTDKIVEGEGLSGLTRAFFYAGSPRVLVSLWSIDDRAAAGFLAAFYGAWTPSTPTAQALATAREAARTDPKRGHPVDWAAWSLWGLPN
jgi:CHAT domain-containing protein